MGGSPKSISMAVRFAEGLITFHKTIEKILRIHCTEHLTSIIKRPDNGLSLTNIAAVPKIKLAIVTKHRPKA